MYSKTELRLIRKAWQRYDKATAYNNRNFDPVVLAQAKDTYMEVLQSVGVNTTGLLFQGELSLTRTP